MTAFNSKTRLASLLSIFTVLAMAANAQAVVIPVTSWADDIASGNGTNNPVISSPGSNARIAGSFATQTLGVVGDSISVTGSLVLSGNSGNQPQGTFRFGLLNHNGSPSNSGWQGFLALSDGENTVSGGSLYRKSSTSNYTTTGGTDVLLLNDEQVAMPIASGTSYSFEMKTTLLAGNQVQVGWSMTDGASYNYAVSIVDATPSTLSFDRVALFAGNQLNSSAAFSNVNVNVVGVPEPGSIVLLGMGALGMVVAYRRRRTR